MPRYLVTAIALLILAACTDTPAQPETGQPIPTASLIVDGRPGSFAFIEGTIDQTGAWYPGPGELCLARYEEEYNGGFLISNGGGNPRPPAVIHVVENRQFVKVMCRFTDSSNVYEDNAEVGKITGCRAALADGRVLSGGTGIVTAAANNTVGDGVDQLGNDGGNAIIQCTFRKAQE